MAWRAAALSGSAHAGKAAMAVIASVMTRPPLNLLQLIRALLRVYDESIIASNAKPMPVQLLIIDPQNDFCDIPGAALPVTGADADMRRLATLMRGLTRQIDGITLTLDSHQRLDIAHPGFWQRADGGAVTPFTEITAAQARAGEFRPRDAGALPRAQAYLDELEARGRYPCTLR
eukprot:Opistho-1_new@70127